MKIDLVAVAIVVACTPAAAAARAPAHAESGAQEALPVYRYPLSGGDKLRVIIFGAPTLGGDFTIGGDGTIAMPLIGAVDTRGLTAAELSTRISGKLADGYMNDPRVSIEVLSMRPFYILGEVNKPGEYVFVNGLTIAAAVAQAGGYTYRAKIHQVSIQHAGKAEGVSIKVADNTPVAPGDTIRVPERWF